VKGKEMKARCSPATYFCEFRKIPLDRKGEPFRRGFRLCGKFDCIEVTHITQSRYIAKKIYGRVPLLYKKNKVAPVPIQLLLQLAKPVDRFDPPKLCKVPECKKPHRGLGLCNAHHNHLYRYRASLGKPERIRQDNSEIDKYVLPAKGNALTAKERYCHYPECTKSYFARGLCKIHHKRWMRWRKDQHVRES